MAIINLINIFKICNDTLLLTRLRNWELIPSKETYKNIVLNVSVI